MPVQNKSQISRWKIDIFTRCSCRIQEIRFSYSIKASTSHSRCQSCCHGHWLRPFLVFPQFFTFDRSRHPALAKLLFFYFMLFVTVLLMNMLIAMMANTYQNVSKTAISNMRNSEMHQGCLETFRGIWTAGSAASPPDQMRCWYLLSFVLITKYFLR